MMRHPSTFPLNPGSGDGIDTHTTKNNIQGEPLYNNDKTPDVVSNSLIKSSEQLELTKPPMYGNIEEEGDSPTYGNIEEEGDSLYEAVSGPPTKAKNGKRLQTTSDRDKIVAPPPKKASNGSEDTTIDQSFLRSKNIMKDGYYHKATAVRPSWLALRRAVVLFWAEQVRRRRSLHAPCGRDPQQGPPNSRLGRCHIKIHTLRKVGSRKQKPKANGRTFASSAQRR